MPDNRLDFVANFTEGNNLKILVAFLVLFLAGCGKDGPGSASSCGTKSVFSKWVDNGGVVLDLSPIPGFGRASYRLNLIVNGQRESCNMVTEVAGDQCSGTVTHLSAQYVQTDPNHFSTICADLIGAYDYRIVGSSLVYGRRGGKEIVYH